MDVDQATGNLYFVYYDRRNATEHSHLETQVYMAMSVDGGETIYDFPLERGAKASFVPKKHIFFGDYNNVSAHDGVVRPIWTRMDEGKLSVWTSIVDTEQLDDRLFHMRSDVLTDTEMELDMVLFKKRKRLKVIEKIKVGPGPGPLENFSFIWDASDLRRGKKYNLRLMQGDELFWSTSYIEIDGKSKR